MVRLRDTQVLFFGGWRGLDISERTLPAHWGESGKPIPIWLLGPLPPKEHRNIKTEPGPAGIFTSL